MSLHLVIIEDYICSKILVKDQALFKFCLHEVVRVQALVWQDLQAENVLGSPVLQSWWEGGSEGNGEVQ